MKRVVVSIIFVVVLSPLSFAQDYGWEYKGGQYVNDKRSEKMSESDLFKYGQAVLQNGLGAKEKGKFEEAGADFKEAAEAFGLLARHAENHGLKEDSLFVKADAYFDLTDYENAYDAYESFINLYRESPRTREAMKKEMDSAVLLAQKGTPQTLLGITVGSSSSKGLDLLKDALARYPYEEFSPGYYMWLADYYYSNKDYDGAAAEYKFIVDNYKNYGVVPEALYKLAICSLRYVQLESRDSDIMVDAKRHLDKLVEEYPRSDVAPDAQRMLDAINEKLGEHDYERAEFYMKKDKIVSAAFYYRLVLKNYKDTTWAKKATERLKGIQDKVAKLEEGK